MSGGSGSSFTAEQVKAEVRQTIKQLSEMTRTEANFDEFCQQVLSRVVQLTGAHGALLWQVNGSGQPAVTHKAAGRNAEQIQPNAQQHGRLVLEVVNKQQPLGLTSESLTDESPDLGDDSAATGGQTLAYLMLFSPVFDRQKNCCGSIELLQRNDISDSAQQGYLRFLGQIAQLFPRWHEHQDLERLTVDSDTWSKKIEFITEVHRSLDFKETCYAIANETRRLLKCDRASVAKWNGRKCKVIAISSQDRFDNRANVVRKLGYVATASVAADTPFWITGETEGIAPEVASKINDYLDESHSRSLVVLPLVRRPPDTPDLEMDKRRKEKSIKLGCLVFEYFDRDVSEDELTDLSRLAVEQSTLALDNSSQLSDVFLLPLWRRLGQLRKFLFKDHYAKTMTGLTAVGLLLLALIFYQAQFKMKVDGVMQPEVRRNLFAQTDGIIREVLVAENQQVEKGQLLAELQDFRLAEQIGDIQMELDNISKRVETINSQLARVEAPDSEDSLKLSSELVQLRIQNRYLTEKLKLLYDKQEKQKIIAPFAGKITTWEPKQRLTELPRSIGQLVLSIADTSSQWQIELRIPQNKIGYVTTAMAHSDGKPLKVEFILGTNANRKFEGELVSVAQRAELSDAGVPEFRALVNANFQDVDVGELRPGTGATAKIICGRKPMGFVWFYQVIDFLRTRVFF
jgi:multidrug efflux pump subunit AcrA (membrane-fusion protein)